MDSGDTGSGTIRVLVADDHPVVRRGMTALLSSLDGVEVVAEASTGAEALREAQLTRPDVVVMDVQMPAMDGVEATRRLTTLLPDVAVLVLTMFEDDETVLSAMRAGARGYLLKGAEQDDILAALHSVVAGQVVDRPRRRGPAHRPPARARPGRPALPRADAARAGDPRPHRAGPSNGGIAAELGLSPKTVGNHVSAIFAKLRVVSRAEAIVRAREEGLGRPPEGTPP